MNYCEPKELILSEHKNTCECVCTTELFLTVWAAENNTRKMIVLVFNYSWHTRSSSQWSSKTEPDTYQTTVTPRGHRFMSTSPINTSYTFQCLSLSLWHFQLTDNEVYFLLSENQAYEITVLCVCVCVCVCVTLQLFNQLIYFHRTWCVTGSETHAVLISIFTVSKNSTATIQKKKILSCFNTYPANVENMVS